MKTTEKEPQSIYVGERKSENSPGGNNELLVVERLPDDQIEPEESKKPSNEDVIPEKSCNDEEEESPEARIERLGRERPAVFKSLWAEIAFVFSISMSQVLSVRVILPPASTSNTCRNTLSLASLSSSPPSSTDLTSQQHLASGPPRPSPWPSQHACSCSAVWETCMVVIHCMLAAWHGLQCGAWSADSRRMR